MDYTAKAVANYFYDLSQKDKKPITPLQMQKLVYIAHGWHLGITGQPLVADEYAEAWEFGPVFPSLYHEFKHFRGNPIKHPAEELRDWEHPLDDKSYIKPNVEESDEDLRGFLNQIWEVYNKYSGRKLSAMSHGKGTPWSTTREREGEIRNASIRNEDIEAFYKARLER